MGINRASAFYPKNAITVDTGSGIDVRVLFATNANTLDATQTASATNAQDNVERTFDPATGAVTNTNNAGTTLFKMGWATQLADDMTPTDDANCNAMLMAGTYESQLAVTLTVSGGTGDLGGTQTPTWRCSWWRYNISTDTGTLILSANNSPAVSWSTVPVTGDQGVFKSVIFTHVIPSDVEFLANEVLLMQVGLNTGTLTNPAAGTSTYVFYVRIDDPASYVLYHVSSPGAKGIRQWCRLTGDCIGKGTATRGALEAAMARSAVGKGTVTSTKATVAAKSFDLVGKGTVTSTKVTAAARSFSLVGVGTATMTRAVVAAKSFSLVGKGTASESGKAVTMARTAVGKGVVTSSKATVAAKSFDLVGKGLITEVHPVQAFRTFNLVGKGEILTSGANASTITIPIDEVPDGGGGGTTVIPVFNNYE